MTWTDSVCEVCDRKVELAGVAASAIAPLSQAICRECVREHAEPLWLIFAMFDEAGGAEHIADWAKRLRSFADGRYIDWDEIVTRYKSIATQYAIKEGAVE